METAWGSSWVHWKSEWRRRRTGGRGGEGRKTGIEGGNKQRGWRIRARVQHRVRELVGVLHDRVETLRRRGEGREKGNKRGGEGGGGEERTGNRGGRSEEGKGTSET